MRLAGALVLSTIVSLAGCSSVPDVRTKLEGRRRFVVLIAEDGLAFSDLPAAVLPLEAYYRPVPADRKRWVVRPIEEAHPAVRSLLHAAREELLAKGYTPATAATGPDAPDLVVRVRVSPKRVFCSLSPVILVRVALDLGGPLDAELERASVATEATPDDEEPHEWDVTAEWLVRDLVRALPEAR